MVFKFIIVFLSTISLYLSQLTETDKKHIVKLIKGLENDKSGLFGDFEQTLKAITVLNILDINLDGKSKICREIGYEATSNPTLAIRRLDQLLKCKTDFTNTQTKQELGEDLNIDELYNLVEFNKEINGDLDLKKAVELMQKHRKGNIFARDRILSLSATLKGLSIYTAAYEASQKSNNQALSKSELKTEIVNITNEIIKHIQQTDEVINF